MNYTALYSTIFYEYPQKINILVYSPRARG